LPNTAGVYRNDDIAAINFVWLDLKVSFVEIMKEMEIWKKEKRND
jgi:hypothetical protein